MTEYTSDIKRLPYDTGTVYEVLADLRNLAKVRDRIPEKAIEDITFERDACSFRTGFAGDLRLSIVERVPDRAIKFAVAGSPVEVYLWVRLDREKPQETRMQLTVHAELNPLLKPMLSEPLQKGLDKIADILASIPYETLGQEHQG
jgi:carbon monoxide dehydrogenase subunit G